MARPWACAASSITVSPFAIPSVSNGDQLSLNQFRYSGMTSVKKYVMILPSLTICNDAEAIANSITVGNSFQMVSIADHAGIMTDSTSHIITSPILFAIDSINGTTAVNMFCTTGAILLNASAILVMNG